MRQRKPRRVYHRRYLIFSLLILMAPMLVLGFALYGTLIWKEYDRSIRAADESINLLSDNLNALFSEFDNIALQLRLNGQFQLQKQRSALDMRRSIGELRTYAIANHNIRELIVWIEGFDFLLSSNSSYTLHIFINGVYQFEHWDEAAMRADLTDGRDGLSPPEDMVASNVHQRVVRYRKTIQSAPGRRVIAYFLMDESTLRNHLREGMGMQEDGMNVLLLDAEGQFLLSAQDAPYLADKSFWAAIRSIPLTGTAQQNVRISGTGSLIQIGRIGERTVRGNTILALIPERALMAEPARVLILWVIGTAATLALGLALIWVFMRKNYHPIEMLQQVAVRYAGGTQEPDNELAVVREAIESLGSSNNALMNRIEQTKPAVREWALSNLLSGNIVDLANFNHSYQQVGLQFTRKFILVVCLEIETPGGSADAKRRVLMHLTDRDEPECYCYNSIQESALYLVASVDSDDPARIETWLREMMDSVYQVSGVRMRAGVGTPCETADRVRGAYIEAFVAKDYLSVATGKDIIQYGEVHEDYENILLYPNKQIEAFRHALNKGDENETVTRLDELFGNMRQSGIPLFAVRGICYNVVNMMIAAYYGARKTYADQLPALNINITALTEFQSVDELTRVTKRYAREMIRFINKAQISGRSEEFQRILNALDEAYLDEQFSLQQVADRFHMPLSTLSAHFKNRMGETPLAYINRMRMERAKILLRTTDLPVITIAQQVGYIDPSNFTRKFRTEVGETPGEYRKRYGENRK
ncbi:MAG: helix-turn-helix domain-containing protein [Oscillospiraceae bacterium]|jgi:AraC-like DNA-binding protein|nr:helix-turn-helix domain-containing protein [Oscillospiraceae bacterium]